LLHPPARTDAREARHHIRHLEEQRHEVRQRLAEGQPVAQIAREMGVYSLEVSAIKSHNNRPNSERRVDIYADPGPQVSVASESGIRLNSLDLHCDLIMDDQAVAYLLQGIDFAAEAGIPTIVNGEVLLEKDEPIAPKPARNY
jgi:hypothetical protein